MKRKTEKLMYNFLDIQNAVDFLEKNKIPYTMDLSNYTTTIECEYYRRQYLAKKQSMKTFIAFQKIKSDLDKWTANEKPEIKPEDLIYFKHNLKESFTFSKIWATDIKSAYATVLLNDYFIQPETFEYISSLNKHERLACVGMLASKKEHFYFNGEELNYSGCTRSEYAPYFYHCINKTAQIMEGTIKDIHPDATLFYWVDCVYTWINQQKEIGEYLKKENYLFSQKLLKQMKITENPKHFFVNYIQEGQIKTLNFPKPQNIREKISNYFLEKAKNKQNIEKSI